MAISEAKQDVFRTAVAVDGKKRVWVFYSANRNANYDLYARSWSGGRASKEVRITSDAGTDLYPVAASDSSGKVWVAWQGFRNSNLEILAATRRPRPPWSTASSLSQLRLGLRWNPWIST